MTRKKLDDIKTSAAKNKIGNTKNTIKFKITLTLRKNIRKNNFIVIFGLRIAIFEDIPIDLITGFHQRTISYFVYANKILTITEKINKIKNKIFT